MRRSVRWPALLIMIALLGAACGGDDDDSSASAGDDKTEETSKPKKSTTTTAAEEEEEEAEEGVTKPSFEAGTSLAALQEKGKLVVGTKFDQPGFGLKNPTNDDIEGFDIAIAKLIAAGIFGGTPSEAGEKITFTEAVSANREPFIAEGKVDLVVATYTINDARKMVVDFAGPYFLARQDIMVKKDNTTIKKVDDLNGKKVCSVQGSTSIKNLAAKAPKADSSISFKTYSECAEALGDGRVEAVTTDDTILAGLAQASSGAFKLVGAPFSDEPYGIGLKKGDKALRDFVNNRLEEIYKNGDWASAFEVTLGKLGLETPEPPAVNRY